MVAFLFFAKTQSTLQQVSIHPPKLHLPTHAYVQSYFAYVLILLCLSSFSFLFTVVFFLLFLEGTVCELHLNVSSHHQTLNLDSESVITFHIN